MTDADRGSVSIVLPTLDEESEIEAALQSIGLESGHEIIVVDGGSRDATRERATALGARVVSSLPGRARQMNTGAKAASRDVLLFLHADTRLPRGWDVAVSRSIEGGAVAGRFDVELRGSPRMLRVVAAFMNFRSRHSRIYTGDQAIFVRRAVFESIGGYEDIALMEDIAISRRLKREGPIASLRERVSTSGRRWEQNGVARTILLMWGLRFAYFVGVAPARLARWYR